MLIEIENVYADFNEIVEADMRNAGYRRRGAVGDLVQFVARRVMAEEGSTEQEALDAAVRRLRSDATARLDAIAALKHAYPQLFAQDFAGVPMVG